MTDLSMLISWRVASSIARGSFASAAPMSMIFAAYSLPVSFSIHRRTTDDIPLKIENFYQSVLEGKTLINKIFIVTQSTSRKIISTTSPKRKTTKATKLITKFIAEISVVNVTYLIQVLNQMISISSFICTKLYNCQC